ncbi:MAG TPA: exosome complex RNA-binding protein Rrp4 [Thermoplasmata archaeon]|jgi:exosome complex component RRP4|nr:exosome complex RNA-binding protein Rrp4 [Thermoplasmata archaeon]
MDDSQQQRLLVVPGDLIETHGLKPGEGTYVEDGKVYASQLGIVAEHSGYLDVMALGGRYIPRADDEVLGLVIDLGPSHWLIDINSPYPAPLHATESPWRVEFGETSRFLDIGDVVIVKVLAVDETKRVQATMRDQGARRITGGQIVEVSPTKVPRVIGKGGSMITMIKNYTKCQAFVGQNGRVWIDGPIPDAIHAVRAIHMIEERAQVRGLTEAVKAYLESAYGNRGA